jgi:hypothetical protein
VIVLTCAPFITSRKLMRALFLLAFLAAPITVHAATLTAASCNSKDIQSKINRAKDGDTVQIPAGSCVWTSNISSSKPIVIQGAGTMPPFGAATSGGTSITINMSGYDAVDLHESKAGSVTLANITFIVGPSSAQPSAVIFFGPTTGGQPVILHHLTFQHHQMSGTSINNSALRGIIYRNRFEGDPSVGYPAGTALNSRGGIRCKNTPAGDAAWASLPTYGTSDTNGTSNLYIETNEFEHYGEMTDFDDGCRAVFRYNTVTNSSVLTHGRDTSPVGARHWEIYNNTFICAPVVSLNAGIWLSGRGGTGVIADNVIPDVTAACAQTPNNSMAATIQVLYRPDAGCYRGPYPWQHQFGWGFDGSHRRDSSGRDQQLEPTYIWNNAKTVGGPEVNDFVITNHADSCSPPTRQLETNYMQQNREYFLGVPQPAYTKYQYPHPLATGGTANIPAGQR